VTLAAQARDLPTTEEFDQRIKRLQIELGQFYVFVTAEVKYETIFSQWAIVHVFKAYSTIADDLGCCNELNRFREPVDLHGAVKTPGINSDRPTEGAATMKCNQSDQCQVQADKTKPLRNREVCFPKNYGECDTNSDQAGTGNNNALADKPESTRLDM